MAMLRAAINCLVGQAVSLCFISCTDMAEGSAETLLGRRKFFFPKASLEA